MCAYEHECDVCDNQSTCPYVEDHRDLNIHCADFVCDPNTLSQTEQGSAEDPMEGWDEESQTW
jgi:hypothetical protein